MANKVPRNGNLSKSAMSAKKSYKANRKYAETKKTAYNGTAMSFGSVGMTGLAKSTKAGKLQPKVVASGVTSKC